MMGSFSGGFSTKEQKLHPKKKLTQMLNKYVVKYDMKHKGKMGPCAHFQYPYGEETSSYQVSMSSTSLIFTPEAL